jgi:hypothetical protein
MISVILTLMAKGGFNMKKNLTIPVNLLEAINHMCTYSESKVLLATMCYGDAAPTSTQMGRLTGIVPTNNYFKVRKQLLNIGYLILDGSGIRVNADKILSDYLLTN